MNDLTLPSGRRVHLIGDPHLGKKFEQGVPSHRRGEREHMQAVDFTAELETDADMIVMVGDLFDTPYVSDAVIVAAARAMLGAAERNPDVTFVALAGNHDVPRNLTVVGAWQAFREMTAGRLSNLFVLTQPAVVDGVALFPWEWDRRADAQVTDLLDHRGVELAVGHWDLSVFDGKDDHLAPVAAIRAAWGEIPVWSGHYHKAGAYEVNGITVWCTGSMQPYSHSEDDEGRLYVTLTREEALARDDLHDKHVRILLAPGEDMPDIDCLALTHKRVREEAEVEETITADDFDFNSLVIASIQDRAPQVRDRIMERMSLNVSEEQR